MTSPIKSSELIRTNQRLLDPVHYYDPTLKVKCGGKCYAKLDQYLRYPL